MFLAIVCGRSYAVTPILDFTEKDATAEEVAAIQSAWAKRLKVEVETKNSIDIPMRLIPPGKFQMGSPEDEASRRADEARSVEAIERPFLIAATETTQAQWKATMGTEPAEYRLDSPNSVVVGRIGKADPSKFPVESVSWYDAIEFCNALSLKENMKPYYELSDVVRKSTSITKATVKSLDTSGYRLPTEVEWEYACRAGTNGPFPFGAALNGTRANVVGTEPYGTTEKGPDVRRPAEVGSYAPNSLGLFDTVGNVSEFCFDWHTPERAKREDPSTFVEGGQRVARGGAWKLPAVLSRSAARSKAIPVERTSYRGFRIARGK